MGNSTASALSLIMAPSGLGMTAGAAVVAASSNAAASRECGILLASNFASVPVHSQTELVERKIKERGIFGR